VSLGPEVLLADRDKLDMKAGNNEFTTKTRFAIFGLWRLHFLSVSNTRPDFFQPIYGQTSLSLLTLLTSNQTSPGHCATPIPKNFVLSLMAQWMNAIDCRDPFAPHPLLPLI
jgi:hypothetical protein